MKEIKMENIREKLNEELKSLIEKYQLKNISLVAETEEEFIGIIAVDSENYESYFKSVLNIARLYQSSREKVLKILEDIVLRR